jgi:lipoprotein Spr
MTRVVKAVVICSAVFAHGCSIQHVTRGRPSPRPEGSAASYRVPRTWDYRAHYRVPADRLKRIIASYVGVRYRYGGTTRRGMDCSGFVNVVFGELNHAKLPRSSRAMSRLGRAVPRKAARAGDLVFFRGGFLNRIDHVGIYLGEGKFAHVSRSKGVTYSSLAGDYYRRHYAGIRRIF